MIRTQVKKLYSPNHFLLIATELIGLSSFAGPVTTVKVPAITNPAIQINSGQKYTNSTSVNLSLSASNSPAQMYITNSSGCTSGGTWETFSPTKAWTLKSTNTLASVFVKYRNTAQAESSCVSASITHDNLCSPPTIALLNPAKSPANITAPSISVTLATAGDTTSLYASADCSGPPIASGKSTTTKLSIQLPALEDGRYTFSAMSTDDLGNTSVCSTSKVIYTLDTNPPTSPTLSINSGATYSNSTSVNLNLSAVGSPTQVYVTKNQDCTTGGSWQKYVPNLSWIHGLANGLLNAYVKYRDAVGNTSECVNSSITIDTTPPASPSAITLVDPLSSISPNRTPTFHVTGVSPLDQVSLHTDGSCTQSSLMSSDQATDTFIDLTSKSLSTDAIYKFYAKVRDLAGNTICSKIYSNYKLKTTPTSVRINSPSSNSFINTKSSLQLFPISGSCSETGRAVDIDATGGAIASTTCNNGQWNTVLNLTNSPEGPSSVTITASHTNEANTSAQATVTLTKDTSPPSSVAITSVTSLGLINRSNVSSVSVAGTCSETGSGNIRIYAGTTSVGTLGCTNGAFNNSSNPFNFTSISDGLIKLAAVISDPAGNTFTSTQFNIQKDTSAPSSPTITIEKGSNSVGSTSVSLGLSAADNPSEMYITNNSDCASGGTWEPYSTTKGWTLSGPLGPKSVYVKYRDTSNNESSCVSDSIIYDTTTPSLKINNDAAYTNSTSVTLSMTGIYSSTQMYITSTQGCLLGGTWEAFSSTRSWTIGSTNQTVTIYAQFKTASGYLSPCISDSIIHDNTPPNAPTGVTLGSYQAATNSLPSIQVSGVSTGTRVELHTNSSCTNATPIASGNATGNTILLTPSALENGSYTFYAKSIDAAGNSACSSNFLSYSYARSSTSLSAPALSINSGASYTKTGSVNLSLSVTGNPTEMYITNAPNCSSGGQWENYTTSKPDWMLGQSNTTATVYVKFRDSSLNESLCVSDTIIHDDVPPSAPGAIQNSATGATTSSSPTASWTRSTDATSGISYYELSIGTTQEAADIYPWSPIGNVTSKNITNLNLNLSTTYFTRVRAIDSAGNVSSATQSQGWSLCPLGYAPVPKNPTYSSAPFCVAKYEAKKVGPMGFSIPETLPWTVITQAGAITACQTNGTSYDLISNSEWQALARNLESVATNWTGGAVGSGEIYRGNSGNSPRASLAADSDDTNGTLGVPATTAKINIVWAAFNAPSSMVIKSGVGNKTDWIKAACNNKTTCSMDPSKAGDPAPNLGKSFSVIYTCSDQPTIQRGFYAAAEAAYAIMGCSNYNTSECGYVGNWTSAEPHSITCGATIPGTVVDRRTHVLSNGQVVWDVAGNVWEWVKEVAILDLGSSGYLSQITPTSHTNSRTVGSITGISKLLVGPYGDYTALNSGTYGGLGYATFSNWSAAFARGGAFGKGAYSGIFAVDASKYQGYISGDYGFRCVYHPGTSAPSSAQIQINSNATYTQTETVSLTLGATGATEMYITNTTGCSSGGTWEAYSTSKTGWILAQTNSAATVYVKYRNPDLNESACISDTIIHDNTPPTAPSTLTLVTAASGKPSQNTPTLQLSGLTSGDTITLHTHSSCSTSSQVASGVATGATLDLTSAPLPSDGSYTFYAKATDPAGNSSSCSTASLTYLLDTEPPQSPSMSINSGSSYTSSTTVTLTLSVTGATQMYITNIPECISGGSWETYSTSKTGWILAQNNSTATVYVKFRDAALNESTCVNDTIIHDNSAPTAPSSLTLITPLSNPGNNSTPTIQIGGLTSGLIVSLHTDSTCSSGSQKASGTATGTTLNLTSSALPSDGAYNFYTKSSNTSGNSSPCSTASLSYTLDRSPPTSPTLSIAGGAAYTTTSSVTLSISASGATQMYLTHTAGCTSGGTWETYAASKTGWILAQTNTTATVYVKFRDTALNESTCASDTIIHDNVPPTAPGSFVDGSTTTSLTSAPAATWSASSDSTSGIAYYEIAIGTSLGGSTIYGWTNIGNVTSFTVSTLSLTQSTTYYTSIRVRDNAGNISTVTQGDGWTTPASMTASGCPLGYIRVPKKLPYTSTDFCVAKYEASNSNGVALSATSTMHWGSIDRDSAIVACQNNGTKYDLITNAEWQTVAQNIELVASNWSGGTVGNGMINRGHSDGTPANGIKPGSNDADGCINTGQTCSNTTWNSQRRTHVLSNGEVIWDLAGNSWEWIKDNNTTGSFGTDTQISLLTATSHTISGTIGSVTGVAKTLFGTSASYPSFTSGEYGGFGRGWLGYDGGAIARGGYWSPSEIAGIYSVRLDLWPGVGFIDDIGFRCVYHP